MSTLSIITGMASGRDLSRRALLKSGGAGLTALPLVGSAALGRAFALQPEKKSSPGLTAAPRIRCPT
jgi:hypothetical protein